MELVSSTLAGNSAAHAGGILLGGEVSLVGSVVAGNAGAPRRGPGPATWTGSRGAGPGGREVARHGGPTPTMLPASDSVVVDRVASSAATDQRGFPRTVGEHADMGSVELTNAERVGLPGIGSTSAPTVEGRVRVGERLRTDGGSWDVEGVQLAYQWLRDGVPVPDATERSYVVSPDDFFPLAYGAYDQRRLSVRVTASAPGHVDGSRLSDLTDRPVRGRMRVERPARVTGKTRVGSILRARPRLGGVVPRPDAVTVSWYVDGTFQRRAYDDRTFRLRPRMRGQRVTVAFRYTSHGYRALRQTDRTSRPVH